MYLQYRSAGPLANDTFEEMRVLGYTNGIPPKNLRLRLRTYISAQPGGSVWIEGLDFLHQLSKEGLLPGLAKDDDVSPYYDLFDMAEQSKAFGHWLTETIQMQKNDDPEMYHYTVHRASREGPWKLQRAWRSDQSGNLIKELPVSGAIQ
ncbi:MAG TPA: hypothetical protein VGO67_10510 [Verrucomicrobiae bacterium]|jgi:hypothetical protein